MTFEFTPTEDGRALKVPFFEDARADYAPYYDVQGKTPAQLQNQVISELVKLGGGAPRFTEGYFGNSPRRYGYILEFNYGGMAARMVVAGLPMKGEETPKKIDKVRIQALSNLRDWLKGAITAQVFSPGSNVLMQYLLVDGKRTLAEALIEDRRLPDTNPALPIKVEKI